MRISLDKAQLSSIRARSHWIILAFVLILVLAGTWPRVVADHKGANLHTLQARAWLQGRLDIDFNLIQDAGGDYSQFNGRTYVAFPPMPALLLVPVVALVGYERTNTTAISLVLAGISLVILSSILSQLGIQQKWRAWALCAFVAGTGYWFALLQSRFVWFFSHTVAIVFILLAMRELVGRQRGWLIGLFIAAATLSRQMMFYGLVVALIATGAFAAREPGGRRRWGDLFGMLATFAVCLAGYAIYNYARFGNPLESGYTYLIDNGFFEVRNHEHGRFSLAYLPVNVYYLLLHGSNLIWDPATAYLGNVEVDLFGASMLAASPFVLVAFYQRLPRPVGRALVAGSLLIIVTQLFYQSNGSAQINTQRYTLDAWPFLMVLVASGLQARGERGEARLWQALIVYAIALNTFMLTLIEPFNRFLGQWLTWF